MRKPLPVLLLLSLLTGAWSDGEVRFKNAEKAIASKDYTTTLTEFEAALTADPDNIQYGSEYRQAVIQAKEYDRCIKFFESLWQIIRTRPTLI